MNGSQLLKGRSTLWISLKWNCSNRWELGIISWGYLIYCKVNIKWLFDYAVALSPTCLFYFSNACLINMMLRWIIKPIKTNINLTLFWLPSVQLSYSSALHLWHCTTTKKNPIWEETQGNTHCNSMTPVGNVVNVRTDKVQVCRWWTAVWNGIAQKDCLEMLQCILLNFKLGEPIRSIRKVSKFCLWRETDKDSARAEPVHVKTMQSQKKIHTYSPAFFV